jgi:hypothetical protein
MTGKDERLFMRTNKFFPFAFLYFFLNTLGLPFGLSWVVVLGPFFYVWVILKRKKDILLPFLALLFPFIFMHVVVVGVELGVYIVSLLNILLLYFFCQAVYTFLKICHDPEPIFRRILIINFVFCLIGIVFYFTPLDHWFWIEQEFTKGVKEFRRFKLFTYEASIYATLFVPIILFFPAPVCVHAKPHKELLAVAHAISPFYFVLIPWSYCGNDHRGRTYDACVFPAISFEEKGCKICLSMLE